MEIIDIDARTMPGRYETPTARLVLSVDAPRLEWLEARRAGITATDLPAILGQSQYRSAIDVWTSKTMPVEDFEAGEAAFWGTKLEEPVAAAWADRHRVKIRRVGLVAHHEQPWMMASLDRIVQGCPDGRCALEVKTRSLYAGEEWDHHVPADVRSQVMWQLAVTGLDHIHVAALIGGQRLVSHRVRPEPVEIERLVSAASLVWEAVRAEVLPDLPASLWTTEYLEQRHPERTGTVELDDREALADYVRISNEISALEGMKAELRTRLVGYLGNADTATVDGKTAYTFKEQSRRSLSAKRLAELHPDAAADERVYSTSTYRTLTITKTKEPK